MTRASASDRMRRRGAILIAALAVACDRPPPAAVIEDKRPFTPWHKPEEPLPFPQKEWFWQELFAAAPAPEPLPVDAAASERLRAAFERVATISVLQSEEELPAIAADALLDPTVLFATLDDARRDVRYAAARVLLRLMLSREQEGGCKFPQRLVEQAARHLRDNVDEVALLHLETLTRPGYAWTAPLLLKNFGKVDNHLLTVMRVRSAAKLALAHDYGGMKLLIKALKENTSIQDDLDREWNASFQTAWWKEEAMVAIKAIAGQDFGHSPDTSDALQVAAVRKIEAWWRENHVRLWSESPPISDPEMIARIKTLILAFGTFQIRNVDNAEFILRGLGPKIAPWLFEALAGSNFMIRRHVLGVLAGLIGEIPESERVAWIDRVAPSLRDPDPAIRARALETIGKSFVPAAQPYLEHALLLADEPLCETALHTLAEQATASARSVLERFAASLPANHRLAVPAAAARLAAGDVAPLGGYLQWLREETAEGARARLYLSWIVELDSLSDAKNAAEKQAALERLEATIRARAAEVSGSK